MSNEQKPFNPLKAVWNVISTISGAVGLVSFADSFYAWNEVFDKMLSVYRNIAHLPFDWVPFMIANWVKDYVFFMFLMAGPIVKLALKDHEDRPKSILGFLKDRNGPFTLILIAIWPVFIAISTFNIINLIRKSKKDNELNYYFSRFKGRIAESKLLEIQEATEESRLGQLKYFFQLILAVVLVFIVFLLTSVIMNR
ncbi:MAG: hypothetical protein HEP71_25730 [Roseivirga sp.]|nr:hypothetical protein [Roseivirga sp.]